MKLKSKKLILIGIAGLIVAALLYRFYPYLLYKNTTYTIQASAKPVKEPTQPLNLTNFQNYLDSLDRSKPEAVTSGIRVLKLCIPKYSTAEADQSFLAFNTFYIEALNLSNESFWQNQGLISKLRKETKGLSSTKLVDYLNKPSALQKDPEIRDLVQQVSTSGFILTVSEGEFYFTENPDFLYNRFSKYLSESLRVFLNLRRQETAEGFAEDAGLQIPFPKVGERIINWEMYLDKFPDSPIRELANYHYQLYLGTFLFGMDNSKVFERKRLKPEVRKVYENFYQRFAETKSGNLIKRYYQVLSSNDFKYTKAVENFLRNNQVQILPGFGP